MENTEEAAVSDQTEHTLSFISANSEIPFIGDGQLVNALSQLQMYRRTDRQHNNNATPIRHG